MPWYSEVKNKQGDTMAGYQFIHVELYARSASKLTGKARAIKGTKRQANTSDTAWTARQIVAEVRREAGQFSPHITPLRPEPLFGSVDDLAAELDELDLHPPKGQRKDTPIMMAGVVSSEWAPNDPRSLEWRMDALAYLHKTFGASLRAVVAHNDEPHDHLHFYVCQPDLKPVKGLHSGHIARQKATDAGDDAKAQTEAYTAAMKALQDDYYNQVAKKHGQARIGPRRERLGRMEWQERQAQAELISEVMRSTELKFSEAVDRVASAHKDANMLIQSARATSMVAKEEVKTELKEATKLKEDLEKLREDQLLERQAFQEEVGLFKKVLKSIYDTLPTLERLELVPFLSAFDQAKAAVLAVRDRFSRDQKGSELLP
ncbi:MAG: hypothetical protein BWK72_20710 [Rhodoferax ferrireducens]|uniref:Plasmid recombination enzyme n=1 Tax=Rhodoferax ferrireducens TaxID=192843 RepID=A0A1W9KNM9_9BURK|nr:MAG: hypothetical protein BWK72_20710 [Rhodoferax ferrireducens]